jgi:hypothetical protein
MIEGSAMTEPTNAPEWPRPYWQPGGEEAVLLFFVFGTFAEDLAIPAARYASAGLPEGVELNRYQNIVLAKWAGYPLAGSLGEVLEGDDPEAFAAAKAAPHVLSIRGRVADGPGLDYLRDTLGVLAGLLDVGGKVIVDPQILSLFDADAWRRQYMVKGGAPPRNHVLILCSDEQTKGRSWVHTRGMRKFGRPDLSLHNVPTNEVDRAGALAERLVELQSLGAHFTDGQVIDVDGVAEGLIVHVGGDHEDPDFNNTHAALHWPE